MKQRKGRFMYLNKNEKKIQTQKRIIEKLQEENECLKEQLTKYERKNTEQTDTLILETYEEYQMLIKELYELKFKYQQLIRETGKSHKKE